jgi:hypothetical protein
MVTVQPLTTVHGAFEAHVLAARLHSEGIDVELRGALGGPYAFTVGSMARVELLVPDDQLDDARLVLLAGEIDEVFTEPRASAGPRRGHRWLVWVAVALLVTFALALVLGDQG